MASAPDQAPPVDPPPPPDTVDSPLPPSPDVVPTTPSDPPPPLRPPLPPNSPPPLQPPVALPPASPPPSPPVDPPPPPPPVDPPPPPLVVEPPTVSPPPPPVVDPPTISPPQPPPDVVPPTISPLPPPPPLDVLSPPPPTDSPPPPPPAPSTDSPPPTPSILPPPPLELPPPPIDPPPPPPVGTSPPPSVDPPPPPPVVEPPTVLPPPPPPPPVVDPPIISQPQPPPDLVPPNVSPLPSPPPPPNVLSQPPPTDGGPPPAPSTDSPPPSPLISPPPPSPSPPPPLSSPAIVPTSPPGDPSLKPNSPPSRSSVSAPVVVAAALGSVALLLAVFGLFWFLFFRKKRERDPPGTESRYKPGDGFNGAPVQSGQTNYPPSGEHPSSSNGSPFPLAPGRPMSSSTGNSSSQPHPMSTSGTGGIWSESSGPDHSSLSSMQGILGSGTISFTYDELKIATNGFSSVNLLGQGGFGYVHKGMLQNGKIVAVKSLKADSGQGEREFQAEVETISRVHHKHLVTLVGYCITDSQKLLVYEFVQNKTLEFHLHGKGQPVMDWPTRLKIAIGSAKGLAYLHEDCHPRIIHRDIKAANILLDHTFEAQVADFGLAKFSSGAETHISTRVMGTFGYLAPEYASTGQLSDKSDVFSFGVLLLELISGRRPVDFTSRAETEDSLVDWARPLLSKAIQDGNLDPLVDPRLENNYNLEEMGAMVTCAASCVRHSAKRRPQLSQVVRALEGNLALADLNDGVTPGFSSFYSQSDLYESPKSEERLRFRKMVFRSGDGNSTSSNSRPTESELTSGR